MYVVTFVALFFVWNIQKKRGSYIIACTVCFVFHLKITIILSSFSFTFYIEAATAALLHYVHFALLLISLE